MEIVYNHKVLIASSISLIAYLWTFYALPSIDKKTGILKVPRYPLIGNLPQRLFRNRSFYLEMKKRYGPLFITNELIRDIINLSGVEGSKWVFKGDSKYLSNSWPVMWRDIMGHNALTTVPHDVHRVQRSILVHAFTPKKLEEYSSIIQEKAKSFFERLCSLSEEGKVPVDVFTNVGQSIFEISGEILIDEKPGEKLDYFRRLYKDFTFGLASIIHWDVPFTTFGKAMNARRAILQLIQEKIEEKKINPGKDLLTTLMTQSEDSKKLTEIEIKDQIVVLLFASYDTTSAVISSMINVLSEEKDVCEKLKKEINEFFPLGQPIDFKKIGEAVYLEAFVKEVLRIYAPVRGGVRDVLEDTEYNGIKIPKGYSVAYNIYTSHEDYFSEPQKFDPERFLEPRVEDKEPYTFIPFGGGPHMCIGFNLAKLEMKIFAITMLREYKHELQGNRINIFPIYGVRPSVRFSHLKL